MEIQELAIVRPPNPTKDKPREPRKTVEPASFRHGMNAGGSLLHDDRPPAFTLHPLNSPSFHHEPTTCPGTQIGEHLDRPRLLHR